MTYEQIVDLAKRVLSIVLCIEPDGASYPRNILIHEYANKHKGENVTFEQTKEYFGKRLKHNQELLTIWHDARQRHHDHYVRLYKAQGDLLSPEDMPNYELAMTREKSGKVKPLAE